MALLIGELCDALPLRTDGWYEHEYEYGNGRTVALHVNSRSLKQG